MTDIELTYFPVHGYRGLMTRLVLDFGGIEYSEKIVEVKEWPSKKGETLMGFLPELKVDGERFAQTIPMLVYLSQIGKMDKLTPLEEFKSGMMLQTATDAFVASVRPAYHLVGIDFQRRKNDLKEMMDDLAIPKDEQRTIFREKVIEGLKDNLPKIEFLLKHFGTENSIVPGKITVGDLTLLTHYMASQYFQMEADFESLVPSAKQGFHIASFLKELNSSYLHQ